MEKYPKTASIARSTSWAIALVGFDVELKYTPVEQISEADALSRLNFGNDSDRSLEQYLLCTIRPGNLVRSQRLAGFELTIPSCRQKNNDWHYNNRQENSLKQRKSSNNINML